MVSFNSFQVLLKNFKQRDSRVALFEVFLYELRQKIASQLF